jgi:hypothetical protein
MFDPISSAVRGFVLAVAGLFKDKQHDDRRKERLRAMLEDARFEFGRTIAQLAAGIGASHKVTRRLLVNIGARPSETNRNLWTLKSPPARLH